MRSSPPGLIIGFFFFFAYLYFFLQNDVCLLHGLNIRNKRVVYFRVNPRVNYESFVFFFLLCYSFKLQALG